MLHQIGNGALGPIFRAYDSDRDRLVAIKVFRLDLPPERVHQLVSEFEQLIAVELQHPVIAAPRVTGIASGNNTFLAQDFAAADSLDIVLRENGRMPIAGTLRVASQLAEALDYAADRQVLHGALHPRDILLSEDDIRIVGIGVSRALERVGVASPVRRPYSAPERMNDEGWDRRADVFSLAAIVYELLCGRRVAGTGSEAAESLTDVGGCDVEALQRVFALALAADPDYRFATASAFTDALKQTVVTDEDGAGDATDLSGRKAKARRSASNLRVVEAVADPEKPEPVVPTETPLTIGEEPANAAVTFPLLVETADAPPITVFAEEVQEQLAAEPPPRVRLPRRRTGPAPTPVAIETAGSTPPVDESEISEHQTVATTPIDEPWSVESPIAEPVQRTPNLLLDSEPAVEPQMEQPDLIQFADTPVSIAPMDDVDRMKESAAFEQPVMPWTPEPESFSEPRLPAFLESTSPPAPSTPPSHSSIWPIGVAAAIGVAVGFGLGWYTVAVRDRVAPAPAAVTASAPAPAGPVVVAPPPSLKSPSESSSPAVAQTPAAVPSAPAVPSTTSEQASAAAFVGRVLVRSTPPGARVFVDGKDRGQTPAAISDLARGEHRVRVMRDGYTAAERRVVLSTSQPIQALSVPLSREPRARTNEAAALPPPPRAVAETGTLVIESRPEGATVLVDGRQVGTTPMSLGDVRAGNHAVRLEREGYSTWTSAVTVAGGEQNRVTASLER